MLAKVCRTREGGSSEDPVVSYTCAPGTTRSSSDQTLLSRQPYYLIQKVILHSLIWGNALLKLK